MAKGMKRERKNADGLGKDLKNMKGTEDPGEQYLYLYCRVCLTAELLSSFFPVTVVSRILTLVHWAQRLNKCPDFVPMFNKTLAEWSSLKAIYDLM